MLNINTIAPKFSLKDQNNNEISLSSFLGKKVILYFYPKDSTPGCTMEAIGYKNYYEEFKKHNIEVIGISKDSITSHQKFICKNELPFILLSDTELNVINQYDVWHEKVLCGKHYMGVVRTTYVIDETGNIIYADDQVKAASDAEKLYNLFCC